MYSYFKHLASYILGTKINSKSMCKCDNAYRRGSGLTLHLINSQTPMQENNVAGRACLNKHVTCQIQTLKNLLRTMLHAVVFFNGWQMLLYDALRQQLISHVACRYPTLQIYPWCKLLAHYRLPIYLTVSMIQLKNNYISWALNASYLLLLLE